MRYMIFIILIMLASSASSASLKGLLQGEPESWTILDTKTLDARVKAAVDANKDWTRSPLLLTLQLLGDDIDTQSLVIDEVKNRVEGADSTRIVYIRNGFLDDSVRGDWHEVDLRRLSDDTWRVAALRVAMRCWRSDNSDVYQNKPCP